MEWENIIDLIKKKFNRKEWSYVYNEIERYFSLFLQNRENI